MTFIILAVSPILAQHITEGLVTHYPTTKIIGVCYTIGVGFEAIESLHPDAVLLDMGMPGAKQASALEELRAMKVVVIPITYSPAAQRKLKRQGVEAILVEPLDMDLLVKRIRDTGL